jgi:hypothetical protein
VNIKKFSQLLIALLITSVLIIGARQKFDTIVAKEIIVSGSGGLNLGVSSGPLDINGKEFILDADADTSITADTDDQIDIKVSGADDFVITANLFESQTGSVIDLNGTKLEIDADADTSLTADTDDQIDIEIAGADEYIITAGVFDIGNGTLGRIDLDADNDTSVRSSAEDQIDIEIGGTDEITLTASRLSLNDTIIYQAVGTENLGQGETIVSQVITWTAAAGGSGTLATIGDGEIWFVHKVFIRTTTNFDATGDDVTFTIGDGNDADGFIVAADANLQATFTEATGYAAGWYGIENGSGGAYTLDDGGPFVYAPSGAAETIDWVIDETSGETITAGQLTAYLIYTRIQ